MTSTTAAVTPPPPATPCAVAAIGEPLAGTAPNRVVWALVEHPGPWGRDAVLDAPWPTPDLGRRLQDATDAADIRVVLARRHGRGGQVGGTATRVVLARCGPGGWAATITLDDATDLLTLDWTALATSHHSPTASKQPPALPAAGWSDVDQVWAVCTQGTRDACCARLGRPIAAAFDALDHGSVWEISHSGGHRFAGVVMALPEGLVYGRVGPHDVDTLATARAVGHVVPRLLRGAVHLSPVQQAAEAALRDHLGEARLSAFAPQLSPPHIAADGDPGQGAHTTTWRHVSQDGALSTWSVDVAKLAIADRPASCGKAPEPVTALVVTSVRQLST